MPTFKKDFYICLMSTFTNNRITKLISSKLFEISVHLSREQSNDQSGVYSTLSMRRDNAAKLNDCINYINTHYKDNITLDMIADAAGFSKYHFTRWFKKNSSFFSEYLNKVRIKSRGFTNIFY